MIKVSFKESKATDPKVVTRIGKNIKVTLEGTLQCDIWEDVPYKIKAWAHKKAGIQLFTSMGTTYVIVSGTSRCHYGDKFDYVIGERLAEARAKIRLYSFLALLCGKISKYYLNLVFGNIPVSAVSPKGASCLSNDAEKYHNLWLNETEHLENLIKGIKENK